MMPKTVGPTMLPITMNVISCTICRAQLSSAAQAVARATVGASAEGVTVVSSESE